MSGFEFGGKSVFLSGPMTGMPDWNREAFAAAADEVRADGAYSVFDPAEGAPRGEDALGHAHWMLRALHELTRYRLDADGNNRPCYDVLGVAAGMGGFGLRARGARRGDSVRDGGGRPMSATDAKAAARDDVMRGRVVFTDGAAFDLCFYRYGREVERFEMDGVRYLPARERDWDGEEER